MIKILKEKIKKLEFEKTQLRGVFTEYELTNHLDTYILLKNIDFTIEILKQLIMEQLDE